jgi:hypothetical protein
MISDRLHKRLRKLVSYSLFLSLLTFVAPVALAPTLLLSNAAAADNAPDTHQKPNQILENAYVGGGYTYDPNNPPTASSALGTQCVFNSATGGGATSATPLTVGEASPYMQWRFTPTSNAASGCSPTLGATPTTTTGMLVHYTSYLYTSIATMQMCEVSNTPMYVTVNGSLMLNDWATHSLPSSNNIQRAAGTYNQLGAPAMPTSGTQTNAWWNQQSIISTTASSGASGTTTLSSPWSHGYKIDLWAYENTSTSYIAIYFDSSTCDGNSQTDALHGSGTFFFTTNAPADFPAVAPSAKILAAQTIAFPVLSQTLGYGATQTLNPTYGGTGAINYTVTPATGAACSVTAGVVKMLATSGNCSISATIAADSFHSGASTTSPLVITATK